MNGRKLKRENRRLKGQLQNALVQRNLDVEHARGQTTDAYDELDRTRACCRNALRALQEPAGPDVASARSHLRLALDDVLELREEKKVAMR